MCIATVCRALVLPKKHGLRWVVHFGCRVCSLVFAVGVGCLISCSIGCRVRHGSVRFCMVVGAGVVVGGGRGVSVWVSGLQGNVAGLLGLLLY